MELIFSLIERFIKAPLLQRVTKFAATSALATIIDFAIFMLLVNRFFDPFYAEFTAAFSGMVVNFFLQKKFVFNLERQASKAFVLSIVLSVIIMFFGAFFISKLVEIEFLAKYIVLAKLIVIASKFILNFITKRWVFENRWR